MSIEESYVIVKKMMQTKLAGEIIAILSPKFACSLPRATVLSPLPCVSAAAGSHSAGLHEHGFSSDGISRIPRSTSTEVGSFPAGSFNFGRKCLESDYDSISTALTKIMIHQF